MNIEIDEKQTATILAALTHWLEDTIFHENFDPLVDCESFFKQFKPLPEKEILELINRFRD